MRNNVVWALGDQAIVSLGAFALQILAGRTLTAPDFGTFALLYGLMMAAYIVNGALVFYPFTLRVAGSGPEGMPRFAGGAVTQAVVLTAPWLAVLALAAWYLGRPDVIPAAATALVAWQAHEALRRMLMAKLDHRRASLGDGIVATGHVVVTATLMSAGRLTVTTAFLAMTANFLVAFAVQALHLRPAMGPEALRTLAGNVKSGRFLFVTEMAGIGITQLPPWVLAVVSGPAAAGAFAAVLNVLKMSHPALLGIYYLIISVVAKERAASRLVQAHASALRLGVVLAALVLPFYAVAAARPRWILRLLYGDGSDYVAYSAAIPILVVAYCLMTVSYVVAGWLNGLEQSRLVMRANLLACAAGVITVWPLASRYGVSGASITVTVMQVCSTAALVFLAARWRASSLRQNGGDAVENGLGIAAS